MAKCDINNKQRLFDVLKSKDIVDMANDNNIEYSATLSGNILNVSVKSGVDNAYIVQSLIENAVNNSFPGILLSSRTEDGYINTILFTERVNNTIKDKRNKRIAKLRFDRSIVRNDGEVISPSGYPAIPMANDRNGIIKNLEKQIHQEATNAWDLGEVADVSNRGVGKLINEYYKSDVVSYYDEGTDLTFPRVHVPEFLVDIYYNELSNIRDREAAKNVGVRNNSVQEIAGIEELFEKNPDFSSQIYEALGFETELPSYYNIIETDNKKDKKERLEQRRELVLREINAIEQLIKTNPDEITIYHSKPYKDAYEVIKYFDKNNWEKDDSKYKESKTITKPSYLHNHLGEELQKRIKNLQIINSSLFDDVEKINYSNIFKEGKSYSSVEVLKYISDNRKDVLSGIAKTLIKYAEKNNVEIQIVKEASKKIAGAYFYSNKIEIYGSKNVTSHTLIHEIIHSFSSDYIKNNPKSLPVLQLENILKNILDKKILKEYSNFEGIYEDYATKNIHELLSEIISRPDILSHLALYDTNYNLIKDIYKKETLLDKIIKALSDILNFSKNEIETLSDLILFNARDIFEASPLWSEFNRNQITPQQKQQAIGIYSQYLEQNPNGSVEQFKNLIKGEKREYKSSPASLPLRGGKKVEYKNASEFSEAINFLSQRFEINVVLNKLNDDSNLNVFGNTGSLGNYDAINNTININKDEEIYEGVIVHEFIHGFSRLVQTYNKEAFRSLVDYHYNSLSTDTETLRSLWRIAYDYGNLETIPKTLSELPEGQNKDYIYDEIFTRLIEREYNENGSLKDFEKPSSIFYKLFELVKKFFGIKYNREKEFSKLTTSSTVKDFYNILKKVDNLKVSKEEYIRGTNTNESIYNVYKILNNREFGELNSQEKEEVNRYMKEYNDYMKSLPKLSISQKSQERLNQIQEIFNQNPELSKIGTVEQYASYLDTIFPNSKVKDIVYHGTRFIFDKFDKSKIGMSTLGGKAFYFTKDFKSAGRYAWNDMYEDGTSQGHFIMGVILNMKNPSYNSQISDINISLEQGQIENLKQKIKREIQKIGRVDTQGTFFPGSLPHSFFEVAFNKDNTAYLKEIYIDNKETILIELGNGRKKIDKKTYTREEFLNISQDNVQKILKSELLKAEKLIKDYNEKVTNVPKNTTPSYTKENDGVIQYNNKTNEYIVFEPEQIHILSSKSDIQGFKDFVTKSSSAVYSQYLDSLNKPNNSPILQGNQQVEEFKGFWNRQQVASQTDKVFLFGDNTNDRTVTNYVPSATQAVIRGLSNAIGIDTKKDRGTLPGSYLTDNDFDWFKDHVNTQIQLAKNSGKTIVIPADGIGTGKAMLKENAPKLFAYLQQELNKLKNNNVLKEKKLLEYLNKQIKYIDEEGNECAEFGLKTGVSGTNWRIEENLNWGKKHNEGGIDLTMTDDGIVFRKNNSDIRASHGLVIKAEDGLVMPDESNIDGEDPKKPPKYPKSIKIKDGRVKNPITGKPFNGNKSGDYDYLLMHEVVNNAKKYGIDPYNFLAMAMQETTLGKAGGGMSNPFHILNSSTIESKMDKKRYSEYFKNKTDRMRPIEMAANFYKNVKLLDKPKKKNPNIQDDVWDLQSWNGYGSIYPTTEQHIDGGGDRYGVSIPKEGINMSKNPMYGIWVKDLSNIFRDSKEVNDLVTRIYGPNAPAPYPDRIINDDVSE